MKIILSPDLSAFKGLRMCSAIGHLLSKCEVRRGRRGEEEGGEGRREKEGGGAKYGPQALFREDRFI